MTTNAARMKRAVVARETLRLSFATGALSVPTAAAHIEATEAKTDDRFLVG